MQPLQSQAIDEFLDRAREVGPSQSAAASASGCEQLGAQWRRIGLRPGDLVILSLPNGIGLLRHFFGILSGGGVPALVAPNPPSSRLRELIRLLGARAFVVACLPKGLPEVEGVVALGGVQVAMFPATAAPAASPNEVVLLTSGTTGFASGCVFGLDALLLNGTRHADAIGQRADDVVLVNLPLCFSFALVAQALATLVHGGRLVISGPPFHPPTYAQDVADQGVTVSSLTPVLVRSLLKSNVTLPPSLRVLSVGGGLIAADAGGRPAKAASRP